MKILLKIEVNQNPELSVNIGLKSTYHEFDVIEDAIQWLFGNRNMIKSYKLYKIEEYETKKKCVEPTISITPGYAKSTMNINAGDSYGVFH